MNIHYLMYLVGFTLMMILNVKNYGLYHCSRKRAVLYTLLTYPCGVGSAILMGKIYNALAAAKGVIEKSNVAIFGAVIFTPLLLLFAVWIEKLVIAGKNRGKKAAALPNSRDTMDLLTPGIFLILTCAKLGCFFGGCCYGIVCSFGFYNTRADAKVFPVQLCEFLTMCAVLFLCYYLKRRPFYRRGMAYPLTAAVYTVGRFVWEYLRYYPEGMNPYAFGMTVWQIFCIFVFVVSVIAVIVLYKKAPSDPLKSVPLKTHKKPVIR